MWFVKMTDALRATIAGDSIDAVANSPLAGHMVARCFRCAPGFDNGFMRAFGEAGAAGHAVIGDESRQRKTSL